MKNTFMVILLVLLPCLIVGCQQGERVLVQPISEPAADAQADVQAIKDIVAEWEAAISANDIDGATSHYTDATVTIPPNEPALIGKESIRSALQKMYDQFTIQEVYDVKDVQVSGDLGIVHVAVSTIATPKDDGKPTKYNGNWIAIFKKQPDSEWSCIYSIWSDESLVYPTQEE